MDSDEENEWLPRFAKNFSAAVRSLRKKHCRDTVGFPDKVNLQDVVQIWEKWFAENPRGSARDETTEKWRAMLEPILPFLNGEKALILVKERVFTNAKGESEDRWFLKVDC